MSEVDLPGTFNTVLPKLGSMPKGINEIPDSKEQITCPTCGETFVAYKSRDRTYCSAECQHKSLEGEFKGERYETPTGEDHPLYVEREERECPVCHTDFEVRKTKNQKACSDKCAKILHGWTISGIEYREDEERECNYSSCQTTYKVPPYSDKKYCSYECAMEEQRGEIDESAWAEYTCENCGEVFEGYTNYDRKYCSRKCQDESHKGRDHPQWKGGWENYYGSSWTKKMKEKIRERDDRKCQNCGMPELEHWRKLDVHHIIPFHTFGVENHQEANTPDNLISLCTDCHMKAEHGKIEVEI